MYIVSYRAENLWRAGIVSNSSLIDAAALNSVATSVRAILEAGSLFMKDLLEQAKDAFEKKSALLLMPLGNTELGPPVPDPDKIICLGLNYREHAQEIHMSTASVPTIFAKFRNALAGPGAPIIIPRISDQIDYEGELAVIIGKKCKEVAENEALSCVAGYSVINDVSARDLQMQTSQWISGKTPDTFAPMGPGIVPISEIPDPQNLKIVTRLNGVTMQDGNTRDMIFPVAKTIAFLSSVMTLQPGDIIATGTPSGVGFKRQPPVFLKDGDIIEVEIEKIGMIRNPVVAAT